MRPVSLALMMLSASWCHGAEPSRIAGKWFNVDAKSNGITRFELSQVDKIWKIRAWASVDEGEMDQGETTLSLLGDSVLCPRCAEAKRAVSEDLRQAVVVDVPKTALPKPDLKYGFAHWDYKFKDTYLTITQENENLIVEDFNVFKDDSERTNYRKRYVFERSK